MRLIRLMAGAMAVLASAGVALAQDPDVTVYRPGDGVTAPVLIKEVKPRYTAQAMRARVQGYVTLEVVVGVDGTVGDARVLEALDSGLDAEAIGAVKRWRFKPGMRLGQPVRVRVEIEMTFTLRDGPPRAAVPAPGGSVPQAVKEIVEPGPGVTPPKLVKETKARYPDEARQRRIEGVVLLDCVVLEDGSVGDVTVARPLDPLLDAAAIQTVREWEFAPGVKDERAVPVRIQIEISFTLRRSIG
jgi:TonB family protein